MTSGPLLVPPLLYTYLCLIAGDPDAPEKTLAMSLQFFERGVRWGDARVFARKPARRRPRRPAERRAGEGSPGAQAKRERPAGARRRGGLARVSPASRAR